MRRILIALLRKAAAWCGYRPPLPPAYVTPGEGED